MISGIVMKEHPYVLKDDLGANPEDQTVFHIEPKTVRSQNATAAAYAGVSKTDRKTGDMEINSKKLNVVDDKEWIGAVKQIDNIFIPEKTAEGACDTFIAQLDANENLTRKILNEGKENEVAGVVVKTTRDPEEIRRIRLALCPDHVGEIMDAYNNYSKLTEAEKN